MQPQGTSPLNTEDKMLSAISRSATVVLSTQMNRYLSRYFSSTELLLTVLCIHVLLNTVKAVPGFTATWSTFTKLMQSIVLQALANFISVGPSATLSIVHFLITIQILECLPAVSGWAGQDLEAFTTNVTYIFADQLSVFLSLEGVPLFGAALGLCLKGQGLLGKTLAFTSVTALTTCLFTAILGKGELSLAWPYMLLYFLAEICRTHDLSDFMDFGLFKASNAVYLGFSSLGAPPRTIAMAFMFLLSAQPGDQVWTGICSLVFVQACSTFGLEQINFISNSDPFLAGGAVLTAVYFCVLTVHAYTA